MCKLVNKSKWALLGHQDQNTSLTDERSASVFLALRSAATINYNLFMYFSAKYFSE